MPDSIFKSNRWKDKISHSAQLGGIETSILDNGAGKGTRIAWINTGTGLRFKVILDRAMDIADAFYNEHSLAWLSHAGIHAPQPFSNRGAEWLRTFGGGLLTTCGLRHTGGPEQDEYGDRSLHGLISNTAAEIESIIQPDPYTGNLKMSITGTMRESVLMGPLLELRRTISATLGEPAIYFTDVITNRANTSSPHMLLYHFNLGWPLVDEGAELILDGPMQFMNEERDSLVFNDKNDFRRCPPPLREYNGSHESVACFDVPPDKNGICYSGIKNKMLGLEVEISFRKEQLPLVTNWQHWAPGEYVTGIEPCTHPPIGQAAARKNGKLLFIEPGESRSYELKLEVKPIK